MELQSAATAPSPLRLRLLLLQGSEPWGHHPLSCQKHQTLGRDGRKGLPWYPALCLVTFSLNPSADSPATSVLDNALDY